MESSDDPWDWDVDRVVREFCTPNRTWVPTPRMHVLPDLKELADKLALSGVDGPALLLAVSDQFMREELDLDKPKLKHAYKARWTIADAISQFRRRSAKYKEHMRKQIPDSSQVSAEGGEDEDLNDVPEPITNQDGTDVNGAERELQSHGAAGENPPPPERVFANAATSTGGGSMHLDQQAVAATDAVHLTGNKEEAETQANGGNDQTGSLMGDEEFSDLLDHYDAQRSGPGMSLDDRGMASNAVQSDLGLSPTETPSAMTNDPSPQQAAPAPAPAQGMKKIPKRLAPTLITTDLDPTRDRELRTEADNVILNRPDRMVPHAVTVGAGGKKRLEPNLISAKTTGAMVSGGIANLETAQELARAAQVKQARAKVDLSKGYLGTVEMPVDDLFFPNTQLGSSCEQSETEDNFFQLQQDISTGRRLYVAKRMRQFLLSQPTLVKKGGRSYLARRPYPEHLVPASKPTSFMLVQKTDAGDVLVTRENMAQWPELESDNKPSINDDEHVATFNLPEGDFPLGGPSSYDNWDPEQALRKYQHLDEDTVLPIYGDSDEENEYDPETWQEMEAEFGEMEQHQSRFKRKPLTEAEVNEAMDEGMALLQAKWHEVDLPKLERKAYRTWMKYRGYKHEQIAAQKKKLNALVHERIPKMRDEILKHQWTTQKQVRRQCQIMERTIFDREEIDWEISLLKQKVKPAKPPRLPKKENRQPVVESANKEVPAGDSESISSTYDEDEDEDKLDFIIDDDLDAAEHKDMADWFLSQSEDEGDDVDDRSNATAATHDSVDSDIEMLGAQIADTEDADDEEEDEDAKLRTPSRRRRKAPTSAQEAVESIDLTEDTPPSSRNAPRKASEVIDLLTPIKKNDQADSLQSAPGLRQSGFRPDLQPSTSETISLSSDDEMQDVHEDENPLPSLDRPKRIAEFGIEHWQKMGDSARMLATKIAKMHDGPRDEIIKYLDALSDFGGNAEIWNDMKSVMTASRNRKTTVQGLADNQFRTITGIIRLFMLYTDGEDAPRRDRFDTPVCQRLLRRDKDVDPFLHVCRTVLDSLQPVTQVELSEREESPTPVRPGAKARLRRVYQDTKALRMRSLNQDKVAEQQKRRERLRQKLNAAPLSGEDANLIINVSKTEDEGLIFVHPEIGHRIKPHQIEGIRFMWNQIVAKVADEELQGCLLAHTMGLGKTMQAITVLVAIAEAAKSEDPTISSQIPAGLKKSRTLIIAPPGLLDNWMDELFLWVPDDVLPKIGPARGEEFRKVDASVRLGARLEEINAWYEGGGILVMGFEGFRDIISKAEASQDESDSRSPTDNHDLAKAREQLLKGPNIVIADEAHKLKNATSKLHLAAKQFRTKSRIALTGSPLSNNVEEYHSMIDWVAPNYLGPIVEFRAKYVEPIQAGLYHNSTRGERRRSKKILEILKQNIEPKVSRCGSEVLKGDLPPKTEFIISVPLTDRQDELYRLYVKRNDNASLGSDHVTKEGSIKQTTLWTWLNMLALLCNHPACYLNRLETPDKVVKEAASADVDVKEVKKEVKKLKDKHHELAVEVRAIMGEYDEMAMALIDSHKIRVLCGILDAAREAEDKVLIFSQHIPTINFLKKLFERQGRKFEALTGDTAISGRQASVKNFNTGDLEVFLISTTAGGVGLNLHGANRVIVIDSKWSPTHEDQAVGRAYRLGQKKHVFVYRLVVGGTFEEKLYNQTIFKTQLAAQVVDKKKILANALRERTDYLFEPKDVPPKDLSEFRGHDPLVLDRILKSAEDFEIRGIQMSEAFNRPDDDPLTAEERKEVELELAEERLKREDPKAWQAQKDAREAAKRREAQEEYARHLATVYAGRANLGPITSYGPPPPSSAPPSMNAAQQRLPNVLSSSVPPSSQIPRARDPIMGSGTRMESANNIDSPGGLARPGTTILDQCGMSDIPALEADLGTALEATAYQQHRQNIPKRAREFLAYVVAKRPNEQYLLFGRIDSACDVFEKYPAITNDLLAGTRSLASIVKDVLEGQLDGPAPADPLAYAPAIETQVGSKSGNSERPGPQNVGRLDVTNREQDLPSFSSAAKLMKGIQNKLVPIVEGSMNQAICNPLRLALPRYDSTELAGLFAREISSAVGLELNKQDRLGQDKTSKDVVFARAADWFMRKVQNPGVLITWLEAKESARTFVRREIQEFLKIPNALRPTTPRKPNKSTPTIKKKLISPAISSPTPPKNAPTQNSFKQSRPAQLDGADSATDTDSSTPYRRQTPILPPSSLSHTKNHATPLSAEAYIDGSGKKKRMPWDNKKKSRSRLGTETPVPAPPRSQPPPSSKLNNNFPNLGGLAKAKLVSPSPFRPSTPQPQQSQSQQSQPPPSLTKAVPSRPSPAPAAKGSNLKDALLNQASAAANGRKFNRVRDETPEEDTSTVSGVPISTTSLRENGGAPSQSQPTSLPAKKKQKIVNKSALPGWANRAVASSQSTPARRRAGSVRSNRSARSTPGPSTQP